MYCTLLSFTVAARTTIVGVLIPLHDEKGGEAVMITVFVTDGRGQKPDVQLEYKR